MATHYCDKCMAPGGVGTQVPLLCNDGTGAHHFVALQGNCSSKNISISIRSYNF